MSRFGPIPFLVLLLGASAAGRQAQDPRLPWIGSWGYTECWPHLSGVGQSCVVYRLSLQPEGERLVGRLEVDGHLTLVRLQVAGILRPHRLQVVVQAVEEGSEPSFKPGWILFDLLQEGGKVTTRWRSLQPNLPAPAGVCFQKRDRDAAPAIPRTTM